MSIEEYWADDEWFDLTDDAGPDFEAGDTVCLKDWPDFVYDVVNVFGDATEVDNCCSAMRLPTAALRKVVVEDRTPPARPDPEEQEVDVDSELTVAELKALEALAGVNHEVRDQ